MSSSLSSSAVVLEDSSSFKDTSVSFFESSFLFCKKSIFFQNKASGTIFFMFFNLASASSLLLKLTILTVKKFLFFTIKIFSSGKKLARRCALSSIAKVPINKTSKLKLTSFKDNSRPYNVKINVKIKKKCFITVNIL